MWEKWYLNSLGIPTYRIISPIFSKKNNVFLIETDTGKYVLKIYDLFGKKGFWREQKILSENKPPLVPLLVRSYKKEAILLSYIEGKRLFDLEISMITPMVLENLSEWFYRFHKENPGYIRGDSIPQNFIHTTEKSIIGIDFEEAKRGDIFIDIAEFAAFILAWKKHPWEERKRIAHTFVFFWGNSSKYRFPVFFKDYLLKFFRKFYHFRKDENIITLMDNIDELVQLLKY